MNTEETLSGAQVPDLQQTADVEKPATPPLESETLRKQRIDDFQRNALADPDALQANLGAINGGLMRLSYRMEAAIEASLAQIRDPAERFERLGPAIDTFLKVARQIDRYAQLDRRLSSPPTAAPTKPK